MKQTSKVLLGLIIVLVLVIAGAAWFMYTNLETLVAGIIAREGSAATGTRVSVEAVSIDLPGGTAGISRLTVANPDGFSDEPAVALGNFTIRLDPMAITEDPLVIRHVAVDGARLLVEQQGTRNNLRTILASLQRQSAEQPAEQEDARKLVIERFEFSDAAATLRVPALEQERNLELPDVVLTDVGRATNGATAAEIAEQVLRPLIEKALERAAAGGLGDALREKLDESVPDAGRDLLDRLGHPPTDDSRDEPDEDGPP